VIESTTICYCASDLIRRSPMCEFQLSSVFTLVTHICSATFPLLLPLPSILCRLYTCDSKYILFEFDTSSLSKQVLMKRKHFPHLIPWENATLGSLMARSNDFPLPMPKSDRTPLFHLLLCSLGWCSHILMSCFIAFVSLSSCPSRTLPICSTLPLPCFLCFSFWNLLITP